MGKILVRSGLALTLLSIVLSPGCGKHGHDVIAPVVPPPTQAPPTQASITPPADHPAKPVIEKPVERSPLEVAPAPKPLDLGASPLVHAPPPDKQTVETVPSDVPVLTGNKVQDKAALIAALEAVKKDWDATDKAYKDLTTGKKSPDPLAVQKLADENAALKARAGRLQEALDKLRN